MSTDSLAEGLNLHRHCFHLIHLDLPYNPNRLEQRNGRIDRYGQQQEPTIRYLYIPGTFEESLLLHLIAKYEKARSSLDVMPDTLGVTADPGSPEASLTAGLSENPDDLFRAGHDMIRTLDRVASDNSPETVAELMRDIDRAFDAFDLMAVSHGWHGVRGRDTNTERLLYAEHSRREQADLEDLTDFVTSVVETELPGPALIDGEMHLPASWVHGLDGLPGFDPASGVFRPTREFERFRDQNGHEVGMIGRAHPIASRAIQHGCHLNGGVAAAYAERVGLLLTYEVEIPVANRSQFREIVALIARPAEPPAEISDWLGLSAALNAVAGEGIWDRVFLPWTGLALPRAERLLGRIAARKHSEFVEQFSVLRQQDIERSRRWLRVKANQICGPFAPSTADLFGDAPAGPGWRYQEDPLTRLISFATDPDAPASKRRDANDVITICRDTETSTGEPGPVVCRPIGMLMLVPRDAV